MRLDGPAMRARVATARVARLATADGNGHPHVVPVVFALAPAPGVDRPAADLLWTAVDQKPKRTRDLRRLRNIGAQPTVSVLVDHYEDDWSRLWWARLDGTARVLDDDADRRAPLERLAAKYARYRVDPPRGPVIEVRVDRWSGWAARGA